MRKNPTEEEYKLWGFLKNYEPKFHRQHIFGAYIVDFYCPKLKLVIEVDGYQHYEEKNIKYDEQRTRYLENLGFKVIRLSNFGVSSDLKNTLIYIDATCRERATELKLNINCGERLK